MRKKYNEQWFRENLISFSGAIYQKEGKELKLFQTGYTQENGFNTFGDHDKIIDWMLN